MAPPDDKKSPAGKAPPKVETINLKVFIHCEGCKKKVKKILRQIEGVETVDIDASVGKVTVTGRVDSKVLLKKLEKAGKVGEVLNVSNGGKGKEQLKDQPKAENKQPKKVRFDEANGDKESKGGGGGGGGASANGEGGRKGHNSGDNNIGTGATKSEENGKKKKGGDVEFEEVGPSKSTAYRNLTTRMIETGYSVESADYATHIFSDENTDSCCIM